jgi:arylsulfatase A-like enzyme
LITPFFAVSCGADPAPEKKAERPNVVLIMCDDLGFSDLGSYGGELSTPRLDQLAEGRGALYPLHQYAGRCCPSRASLLTGRHHHAVEMGWMTAVDEHRPGYRGQLTDEYPTIAEVLKAAGLPNLPCPGSGTSLLDGSFMRNVNQPKPNGSWPTDRGFDEYFGGLSGGGGYYEPEKPHA